MLTTNNTGMFTIGLLGWQKNVFEKELVASQSNLKNMGLIKNAASLPKINREGISQMLIDGVLVSDH
jgi:hypothetical protein